MDNSLGKKKMRYKLLTVLALVGATALSLSSCGDSSQPQKQSQETASTVMTWMSVANDREMAAGSFRASSSYTITRIDVLLEKVGSPTATVTCKISTADGTPGSPTTTILATATNTHAASEATGATWLQYDFAGQAVVSGTDYYVQLSVPDNASSASNYLNWWASDAAGTNRGYRKETAAAWSGNDWQSSIAGLCMKIYGF